MGGDCWQVDAVRWMLVLLCVVSVIVYDMCGMLSGICNLFNVVEKTTTVTQFKILTTPFVNTSTTSNKTKKNYE